MGHVTGSNTNLSGNHPISVFQVLPWILGWVSLTVMGPFVAAKVIYKAFKHITTRYLYNEKRFCGKVVLLTGASSGLGEALAHYLYQRGCHLILASRNIQALNKLKENLLRTYHPTELHVPTVVRLDLEDLNSIPTVMEELMKFHKCIDILINNAGVSYRGEIVDTDLSVHLKLMIINYFGQVALTKTLLKGMIQRKSGHIITISSIQGKLPTPFRSSYSASKHALQSFFDVLRAEVSHYNIYVTTVSPGYIKTNLSLNAITSSGNQYGIMDKNTENGMDPSYVAKRVAECINSKEEDVNLCPFSNKLAIFIRFFTPSLYFFIMKLRAKWHRMDKEHEKVE